MGVNYNEQLINRENLHYTYTYDEYSTKKLDKIPLLIISPGLASHCNGYSIFAKELASKGFLVMVLEHHEEIKNPYFDNELNLQFRRKQL